MKLDFVIKNGHVVDPAQGIDQKMDIAVKDNRIVSLPAEYECVREVDASGCYVFPGLIDYHAHEATAEFMRTIFWLPASRRLWIRVRRAAATLIPFTAAR